jgi:predicted esterase
VTHSSVVLLHATRPLIKGETQPDFTGPKCVEAFVSTPVFVFHGRKDDSTPLPDAERMVDVLRGADAA